MKHQKLLRWSLLGSLGLAPISCSGTTSRSNGLQEPTSGASSTSGAPGETTDGGSDGGPKLPSCTSPTTAPGGTLTSCAEGYRFRGEAVACSKRRDEVFAAAYGADGGAGGGTSVGNEGGSGLDPAAFPQPAPLCHQACEGEHAFCGIQALIPRTDVCQVGCLNDDECGEGAVCSCSADWGGVCVKANCRSDADCDSGYHCATQPDGAGCSAFPPLTCQTAEDECFATEDCEPAEYCMAQASGHRRCAMPLGSCGRPFLVAAQARVAPVLRRNDWLLGSVV